MSKKALMVAACLLLSAFASLALAGGKPSTTATPATTCVSANIPTGTTYTQTDVNLVVTSWCANMTTTQIDTMSVLAKADVVKILCFNKALPSTTRETTLTCS